MKPSEEVRPQDIDFYRRRHRARFGPDGVVHVEPERRHRPPVASSVRELMQALLVAMVALTMVLVDGLERAQAIGLAMAYFVWAGVYVGVMYWESRS